MAGELVTPEAMQAAWDADLAWVDSPDRERGGSWGSVSEAQLRRLLEGAATVIAAAERKRLADRAAMLDEIKAELDDAFQFTNPDGSQHGYVTRAWVQALLAHHAASAGAAEQEHIAVLAEKVDAFYDAPCPDGVPDCVHQDMPFADLIREEAPDAR